MVFPHTHETNKKGHKDLGGHSVPETFVAFD
jgi:hypothetical protein